MARIARGRWTHTHEGDLTVFLIGMRINRIWRPDAWLPVLAAMGRCSPSSRGTPTRASSVTA